MENIRTYIFEKIYFSRGGDILFGHAEKSPGVPDENNPTLFLDAWRVEGVSFKKGDVFRVETNDLHQKTRVWLNGELVYKQ